MAETLVIELKDATVGKAPTGPSFTPPAWTPPAPAGTTPAFAAPPARLPGAPAMPTGPSLDVAALLAQFGQGQAAQMARLVQQAQQVFQVGQATVQASTSAASAAGRTAAGVGAGARAATVGMTGTSAGAGAGAAGAAGAGAGLAAAAGPVGLAVAGAMMVHELEKQVEKENRERVRKFVEHVGAVGKALASLSFQPLEEKIDGTIRHFGVLGEALAETRKQFGEITTALIQTGKRLAPFSGPLAQAEAMSEVRQTLGDLKRAQILGPDLARFMDAQSRIEQSKQNLMSRLLRPFLGPGANLQEKIADLLERIEETIDRMFGVTRGESALDELLKASALPPGVPRVPFAPPPRGGRGGD